MALRCLSFRPVLLFALLAIVHAADASAQPSGVLVEGNADAQDQEAVFRLDLMTNTLVPADRQDLRTGYIYSHFSHRLGRRVWSFLQPDGTFWYALGEGTTQEAITFDIRATEAEAKQRLKEFPALINDVNRTGARVVLKLQPDGSWKAVGVGWSKSIFNAETGQRWQYINAQWIPVVHTGGGRWGAREGQYFAQ